MSVRPPSDLGVYGISVAAELVGSAPQNLRLYEARGLLRPARSDGGTRRYSEDDLERLREIGRLIEEGLNLAGAAMVLSLVDANQALRAQLDELTERRGHAESQSRESSTECPAVTQGVGPCGRLDQGAL